MKRELPPVKPKALHDVEETQEQMRLSNTRSPRSMKDLSPEPRTLASTDPEPEP